MDKSPEEREEEQAKDYRCLGNEEVAQWKKTKMRDRKISE